MRRAQRTRIPELNLLRRFLFGPHTSNPNQLEPPPRAWVPHAPPCDKDSEPTHDILKNPALGNLQVLDETPVAVITEAVEPEIIHEVENDSQSSSQRDSTFPVLRKAIINAVQSGDATSREAAFNILENRPILIPEMPEHILKTGLEDSNPSVSSYIFFLRRGV